MNLLPEENKILFKKYYLKKLFIIFGILIFSMIATGGAVLMPMYSLALSYKNDLNKELAIHSKKDSKSADSAAAVEIKKLNNRLDFVEKMSKTKKLNSIFKNILDKKNPGIKITNFSYEKGKEQGEEDKVFLSGTAQKRDDLVFFEDRLKEYLGDSKFVSPVSNFINEKDFDFSLILHIQNEK